MRTQRVQRTAALLLAITFLAGTSKAGNPVHISSNTHDLPDVALVREDGKSVPLRHEINDGRPVFLNFIFTSCPGICPLLSESFRQLQIHLGDERSKVHMMSISIDPEEDTPARLREYAQRFGAGSQWQHYTGTVQASLSVQRAFGVYNGDKMAHSPVTFFRRAPGDPWVQMNGFASAVELIHVYKSIDNQLAVAN